MYTLPSRENLFNNYRSTHFMCFRLCKHLRDRIVLNIFGRFICAESNNGS